MQHLAAFITKALAGSEGRGSPRLPSSGKLPSPVRHLLWCASAYPFPPKPLSALDLFRDLFLLCFFHISTLHFSTFLLLLCFYSASSVQRCQRCPQCRCVGPLHIPPLIVMIRQLHKLSFRFHPPELHSLVDYAHTLYTNIFPRPLVELVEHMLQHAAAICGKVVHVLIALHGLCSHNCKRTVCKCLILCENQPFHRNSLHF